MAYLFFAMLFLLGFFAMASESLLGGTGSSLVYSNAPVQTASIIAILTAIGQIITTAIAGTAILRDSEIRASELVFTTRLGKASYLTGHFCGSVTVMFIIYAALPLGLMIGMLMPWNDPEKFAPLSVWTVLQPYLVIGLPNVLFVSAIFFAVGALIRKVLAVYVSGMALFVVWSIVQSLVARIDNLRLGAILDPFAINTISVMTRYWGVAEQNTLLVGLSGVMLTNRLLWIAVSFVLFVVVAFTVQLDVEGTAVKRTVKRTARTAVGADAGNAPAAPVTAAHAGSKAETVNAAPVLSEGTTDWMASLRSQSLFHFRSIIGEPAYLAILAIGLVMYGIGLWSINHRTNNVYWPVSASYAPELQGMLFFLLFIATIYGGELIWRERQLKADQIVDSLPAPAWVGYVGKLAAVLGAMVLMLLAGALLGMAMQLAQGYTRLEPLLYGEVVLASLPQLIALAVFTMGVHALVNQKYVGHFVVIGYWVGISVLEARGFDYTLYYVAPGVDAVYSDMNRWGPYLSKMAVVGIYGLASAALLGTLGYFSLVRGTDSRARERVKLASLRFRSGGWAVAGLFLLVASVSGGVFYYNANILNGYSDVKSAERALADWERTYKPLWGLPQPRRVAVSVRVDLYPEQRAAKWQGTYKAVNRDGEPIDSVFISLPYTAPRPQGRYSASSEPWLFYDSLYFDRSSELVHDNTPQGVRIYRLSVPLAPEETLTVHFAGRYEPEGFGVGGFNNDIAYNGSFMESSGYMPTFGYDASLELSLDDVRKRNGLEPTPRMLSIDDPDVRNGNVITDDADWIDFDAVVCTSADQVPIAPGYTERDWTEGGRRCIHYLMDKPVLSFYSVLSAAYDVVRDEHNGVAIEIYHHPWHTFAIPSMIQGSKDGLDYFSTNFSPYQYRQYRVLEFPKYQAYAQSFPNTVPYSEAMGFIERTENGKSPYDYSYFVTVHELAHQWWAHQVIGGSGQGNRLLSEGLAEYSALTVMEKRYGREAAQKFLRGELDGYLYGRAGESRAEVPLLYAESQQYIYYSKAALGFYALRDYIGEERMNEALHNFLAKWAFKGPPYPTARDLITELDAVTADSLKYVLTDLFEEMTFYENKVDSAVASRAADGSWDVQLVLSTAKFRGDSLGAMTPVAMSDYVDVGIYGEKVAGRELGEPLLVKKVLLTAESTVLTFNVPSEPFKAGVDPYNKLIDRTPEDNVATVRKR